MKYNDVHKDLLVYLYSSMLWLLKVQICLFTVFNIVVGCWLVYFYVLMMVKNYTMTQISIKKYCLYKLLNFSKDLKYCLANTNVNEPFV